MGTDQIFPGDFEEYRYPGESNALTLAIIALLILTFGFFATSLSFAVIVTLVGLAYVRIRQGQILGNSVLVSPRNFERVHRTVLMACERLGVELPRVYVRQDPYLNAFALGYSPPFSVVIHSATVHSLDDEELAFVVGHELAHIKMGHTTWLSFIAPLGNTLPGFNLIFGSWQRRSEYTADRLGLIVCGNLAAATRALVKVAVGPEALAHVDVQEFLRQAEQVAASDVDRLGELFVSHPYAVNRLANLISFEHKMREHPLRTEVADQVRLQQRRCPGCGASVQTSHRFCTHCGIQLVGDPSIRTCHACGTQVKDDARYCHECGTPLQ